MEDTDRVTAALRHLADAITDGLPAPDQIDLFAHQNIRKRRGPLTALYHANDYQHDVLEQIGPRLDVRVDCADDRDSSRAVVYGRHGPVLVQINLDEEPAARLVNTEHHGTVYVTPGDRQSCNVCEGHVFEWITGSDEHGIARTWCIDCRLDEAGMVRAVPA